jgi:hypothetical protein
MGKLTYLTIILIWCIVLIGVVSATDTTGSFERVKQGYMTKSIGGTNYSSGVMSNTATSMSNDAFINSCNARSGARVSSYIDMQRGYMTFNTSTIPDDAYLLSAWLTVKVQSDYANTPDTYFAIVDLTPADTSDLTTNDWDDFSNVAYYTYRLSDYTTSSTYDFNVSTDLIHKDGITCLGTRLEWDRLTELNFPSTSYYPDLGDGSSTTYDNIGFFTTSPTLTLYVHYTDTPPVSYISDITATPSTGTAPLTVTFKDNSSNFPEEYPYPEYSLSYGDGTSFDGERQYSGEEWYKTYENPGSYNVEYNVTYDGVSYIDTQLITVGEGESNFYVQVVGTDTYAIGGANVTISYDSTITSRGTYEGTGKAYFNVPPNRLVGGTVTKPGYQQSNFTQYISTWDTWKVVTLYEDDETPGSGDEYWNYVVNFRDANTLETLTNVFVNVYSDSGRTELFLSETAPYGVWTGLLPNGTTYYFTASAANHLDLNWSYTLSGASVSVYKDLIPVTYGGLQPVLNIFAYDTYGTPLKDVGVSVDSDIDDGFHLTNNTGYARHFCEDLAYGGSRNYTITASKGGYTTESSAVTVSTQQPTVYIFMEKSTVATATPTGIYTPVVTPVWSGDGGTPGNIKEQLINTLMTQFGVSQLEANILMGIILTILCAVVVGGGLASYGSGSGAGVGAMIGAVVGFSGSSIIGFFPIWILIVVIVLVFAAWFMFRGRDE